ncbi:MAG: 4-deoxy-4-formamido-L-arabinose-phosphoundecaprenol deformylase [Planctomycetes bacterium]|nr:4-deoxy-4-formamido-L-arabinose-phosphoundecaprenol deformylase [Planctomycetota bacterium]
MKVGLRIDVDTLRGTRLGVPNLCRLFAEHSVSASFFFSVGPDNMGRHLRRLLRPGFLWKMLRTRAAGLYGWDIIFKGTFGPDPVIGRKCSDIIRRTFEAGHEVGLHAWDHYRWQTHLEKMDYLDIYNSIEKGVETLTEILGRPPNCSAVAGWKCNNKVLKAKENFDFEYNSDCRGETIFRPVVSGSEIEQPQIPVTLPTYDEVVGRDRISNDNYNEYLLSLLDPERLNVLAIHAEVEGITCMDMFEEFVKLVQSRGGQFVPLGDLLRTECRTEPVGVVADYVEGRDGWVSCQGTASLISVLAM